MIYEFKSSIRTKIGFTKSGYPVHPYLYLINGVAITNPVVYVIKREDHQLIQF